MPTTLESVRPITLAEVQEARTRIARTVARTPLVRLDLGPDYPDTQKLFRSRSLLRRNLEPCMRQGALHAPGVRHATPYFNAADARLFRPTLGPSHGTFPAGVQFLAARNVHRSEEHTSE